ncbi:hypothetical protein C1H76_3725 [Elsinoe australis]|uniref:A-kinase anchor protein 7-like phosphoesterase domain-containing protein n=1 Tax=Elsinoe australis TaxID=40998 RepID=A0A4U7B5V8_9PEZI|nr:hypothetical protein C1H76_3725 [Elsinoe australis]
MPGKKPPLTHFLCLPLVNQESRPELEASLGRFRGEVGREERGGEGAVTTLPAKAVRPVGSIHLTLGVMSLTESDKLDAAVGYLKKLNIEELLSGSTSVPSEGVTASFTSNTSETPGPEDSITTLHKAVSPPPTYRSTEAATPLEASPTKSGPLTVTLSSLKPMQSPRSTTILYAVPQDDTDRLYSLGNRLRNLFTEAEYLLPDSRPLKLHATIVNTIYVKGRYRQPAQISKPEEQAEAASNIVDIPPEAQQKGLPVEDASDHDVDTKGTEPGPPKESAEGNGKHQTLAPGDADYVDASEEAIRESKPKPKSRRKRPSPMKLDARALIETYKNHAWAKNIVIDRVAICEMGAKDVKNDAGEVVDQVYREVASVPLLPTATSTWRQG